MINPDGIERDVAYLTSKGATFLQAIAWTAANRRGDSRRADMDDYLKGSDQ